MPIYSIQCFDQTHHECEEEVRVRLEIIGLTEAQIEQLEKGQQIELTPPQVQESGLDLTEEQRQALAADGFLNYSIDLDSVCDACGGELSEVEEYITAPQ